jgi:hypothetical protein
MLIVLLATPLRAEAGWFTHLKAVRDYKRFRSMKKQSEGLPKDQAKRLRQQGRELRWVAQGRFRRYGLGPTAKLGQLLFRGLAIFKGTAAVVGQDWLATSEAVGSLGVSEGAFGSTIRALRRLGRTESVQLAIELGLPGLTKERVELWERGRVIKKGVIDKLALDGGPSSTEGQP